MKKLILMNIIVVTGTLLTPLTGNCQKVLGKNQVSKIISKQRQKLAINTRNHEYGPQSPRDISSIAGKNKHYFSMAPASTKMNLCNIHFHKNAEHKGGEYTTFVGSGDGHGYLGGYKYNGDIPASELSDLSHEICPGSHGALHPGDTIEVHYVYSTAPVSPGPTLKSCLSNKNLNPQLRVESQVFVVVNNDKALAFEMLTKHGVRNGLYQALNIPSNTGRPVQYAGSTTGPTYNEKASPYQVTWNVRPKILKVNIESVGNWCKGNVFHEDHAHGVRNLVLNPDLLSQIH